MIKRRLTNPQKWFLPINSNVMHADREQRDIKKRERKEKMLMRLQFHLTLELSFAHISITFTVKIITFGVSLFSP